MGRKPASADRTQVIAEDIAANCVARRVQRQARIVSRIYDDALRPHGINASQLNMLVALTLAGEIQPARLAQVLDMEKSTMSRNLSRMKTRGWIAIRAGDDDARQQRVSLTAAGRSILEAAHPAWSEAQRRVREALSARAIKGLFAKT